MEPLMEPSRPNGRNVIGMIVLIIGLMLYAFGAAALGEVIGDWPLAIQFIYYAIAGVVWIFPVRALFLWMANSKEDTTE